MATLTVASVQLELRAERTLDEFIAHLEELVAGAAGRGAAAVLFPELASTGLLAAIDSHAVSVQSIASDYWNELPRFTDDIVAALSGMAARHDVTIIGGSHNHLASDGSLRNTAYVLHPDGRIESQDKIHLTPPEHALGARGGDDLLVTKIGPFIAGVLICADIQFPELSRHLVSQGVDLIFCPSLTWNRRGVHRVRTGCQARAIENQLYVVMAPLVGSSGLPLDAPMYATGRAVITTPVDRIVGLNDGILAEADGPEEQIIVARLDKDLIDVSRAKPEAPGLALRRLDLFDKLDKLRASALS